mgnify:CR=1 FL=1|jgi:hypothetical protein
MNKNKPLQCQMMRKAIEIEMLNYRDGGEVEERESWQLPRECH